MIIFKGKSGNNKVVNARCTPTLVPHGATPERRRTPDRPACLEGAGGEVGGLAAQLAPEERLLPRVLQKPLSAAEQEQYQERVEVDVSSRDAVGVLVIAA
jgi:hypothetical protein